MLHAKFQNPRTLASEEDFFKGFGHIWAWRPSLSCYQDNFYIIHVPSSQGGST